MVRHMHPATRWRWPLLLAAAILALALTGVGQAQGVPTVAVVPNATFGPILADPDGWTLYTWDGDEPGWSWCYDECATVWPPYLVEEDPVAPDFLPGGLGLIERDDGTWQVTFDEWPLYYYLGDMEPGDANGEGSMGFDARWYVMSFGEAAPVAAAPPAPSPAVSPPAFTPPPSLPPVFALQPPAELAGADVPVSIRDFEFRPSRVNLRVSDTAIWTNNGPSPHTATSDTGLWDTRELRRGQAGSHIFTSAGTFSYHCALHPWMRGTVIVSAAGAPSPSVQIPGYAPGGPYGTEYGPGYPGYAPGGPYGTGYGPGYPGSGAGFPPGYGSYPFGSPGYPYGAPAQTLRVVAPPSGTVGLLWAASPVAQGYRIYQTTIGAPLNFQVVQTISQSLGVLATNATVSGLASGTTYLFQVRAVDASGQEVVVPASANVGPGPFPPFGGAPANLSVTGTTTTTVTLDWTEIPGAAGYHVLQAPSPVGPFALAVPTNASTTTATVAGLSAGATYHFQVRAADIGGNLSPPSNTVSVTPGAGPDAPTSLAVLGTTSTTVALSWTASAGATSYQVLQSLVQGGPFTASSVSMSSTTSATATGLNPNTTYYFQVKALDSTGATSLPSNTVSATTSSGGAGPTGLSATATTSTSVTLSWTASAGAASYQVFFATSPTGPFTSSVAVSAFTTSATVTGLSPNTTYYFQVRASDAFGNLSAPSNTVAALTVP